MMLKLNTKEIIVINENIIKEYDLAYKRKQWYVVWRYIGGAHGKWIAPYLAEMHKRGAYPFMHYYLTNFYSEPGDIVVAAFVAAYFIKDDADVLKTIEKVHAYIGEHPYTSLKNREFVHWKQNYAVMLDGLYRIISRHGDVQTAIMEYMRYALDPADALSSLLKDMGIPLGETRCRMLVIRLATKDGVGLGVWNAFSPNAIMPPNDEVTKWYVSKMFPADTEFPFDELVLMMSDIPYSIMYDAMMFRIMAQADENILNKYAWRIQKTFYGMPSPTTYIMGSMKASDYIDYAAPVYDFETNTLSTNPRLLTSATWLKYEDYINTEEGRKHCEERRANWRKKR